MGVAVVLKSLKVQDPRKYILHLFCCFMVISSLKPPTLPLSLMCRSPTLQVDAAAAATEAEGGCGAGGADRNTAEGAAAAGGGVGGVSEALAAALEAAHQQNQQQLVSQLSGLFLVGSGVALLSILRPSAPVLSREATACLL